EDAAASAMLKYLSRLADVAKLEPVAFCHIPADPTVLTAETDHVIARTAGARRAYYYRRLEHGYWTPWEPVKLDIEDNPVIPYVWNGRLLLFWLRILKQAPIDPNVLPGSGGATGGRGDEPKIADLSLTAIKSDAK